MSIRIANAIVFDTETHGLVDPVIVEAGYLVLSGEPSTVEIASSFVGRYNPGCPIELSAMAIHHILDSDVADSPSHTEFNIPPCEYVIGHKVDFDMDIIEKMYPLVTPKRICTLALARYLFQELESHKLSVMLYHIKGPSAREELLAAHSALADVGACFQLVQRIIQMRDIKTWGELYTLSELARIPVKMAFGKHKGEFIADVPRSYREWYLKQEDKDPYLEKAFRACK